MLLRSVVYAVLLLSCLLAPASMPAYGQGDDKDVAEIRAYVLTMENVKRTYMAMYELKQAEAKEPKLQDSMKNGSDDDKASQSLSATVAKISAYPEIVAILAKNGFTPRQFVVSELAVVQAGLAAAAVQMGADRAKLIAEGAVSATNLAFAEQHHAELDELGKKYPM